MLGWIAAVVVLIIAVAFGGLDTLGAVSVPMARLLAGGFVSLVALGIVLYALRDTP